MEQMLVRLVDGTHLSQFECSHEILAVVVDLRM